MVPSRGGISPTCFPSMFPGTVHPSQSQTRPRAQNRVKDLSLGCAGANMAKAHEEVTEKKCCGRLPLVSTVPFRWHDASEHYGVGNCKYLGLAGIFVIASESPATGTQVCLDVLIRAFAQVGSLRLKYSSHVVRIQNWHQLGLCC